MSVGPTPFILFELNSLPQLSCNPIFSAQVVAAHKGSALLACDKSKKGYL